MQVNKESELVYASLPLMSDGVDFLVGVRLNEGRRCYWWFHLSCRGV